MNGTDVLILVDIGGSFIAVASQTNASMSETNDLRDMSSKDQRERRVAAARYEASLSFEALFVPGQASFGALKSAMRTGSTIKLRIQEAGQPTEEASAVITDMTREFPDQDNVTISLEAAIDGALVPL